MNCGWCGDKIENYESHDCWVKTKDRAQENLPVPVYDFANCRPLQTDAEWLAAHPLTPLSPTLYTPPTP